MGTRTRAFRSMEILWLKSKNQTHGCIAELANVSRSTVQRVLRIFAVKGLDGVRSFGWKGQPSALTPHRATIEEEFRASAAHGSRRGAADRGADRRPTEAITGP
ncbi:helix-turn-helix domain-containing protein [Gemmata sp. G18]|uniref:Helix-turn-helix domain-containing protein n=1 Tax=Gemmata palustris TaxID=2822762 RepID=A0ABS5BNR9_9BACT|nr:helix-turn-helix domain-containing protein [Gemmata palustris]MBP3955356.1 helix-turn-helix domain-containing protein [Gemmata palustris]